MRMLDLNRMVQVWVLVSLQAAGRASFFHPKTRAHQERLKGSWLRRRTVFALRSV